MRVKVKLKIPILLGVLIISLLPSFALTVKADGEQQVAAQNKIGTISAPVINDPNCSAYVSHGWLIGMAPVQIEEGETEVQATTKAYFEKWPESFVVPTFAADTGEKYPQTGLPIISYVGDGNAEYQKRVMHMIQPTLVIPEDARSNWVNEKKEKWYFVNPVGGGCAYVFSYGPKYNTEKSIPLDKNLFTRVGIDVKRDTEAMDYFLNMKEPGFRNVVNYEVYARKYNNIAIHQAFAWLWQDPKNAVKIINDYIGDESLSDDQRKIAYINIIQSINFLSQGRYHKETEETIDYIINRKGNTLYVPVFAPVVLGSESTSNVGYVWTLPQWLSVIMGHDVYGANGLTNLNLETHKMLATADQADEMSGYSPTKYGVANTKAQLDKYQEHVQVVYGYLNHKPNWKVTKYDISMGSLGFWSKGTSGQDGLQVAKMAVTTRYSEKYKCHVKDGLFGFTTAAVNLNLDDPQKDPPEGVINLTASSKQKKVTQANENVAANIAITFKIGQKVDLKGFKTEAKQYYDWQKEEYGTKFGKLTITLYMDCLEGTGTSAKYPADTLVSAPTGATFTNNKTITLDKVDYDTLIKLVEGKLVFKLTDSSIPISANTTNKYSAKATLKFATGDATNNTISFLAGKKNPDPGDKYKVYDTVTWSFEEPQEDDVWYYSAIGKKDIPEYSAYNPDCFA